MFQWIQPSNWLPRRWILDAVIALLALLISGLSDYIIQGNNGLIVALLIGSAFFFFREYSPLAIILILAGTVSEILFGLHPTISGFLVPILVLLASAMGRRLWSVCILAATILSGLLIAWNAAFNSTITSQFYGITVYNTDGRWWAFAFAGVSIIGVNGFAWLLGGFLIELYRERTASLERNLVQNHNLRTALEMAEQSQRFLIASDLNQGILQQVSAMLTLTDGARYAARLDAEVAPRTLDRLVVLVRETHAELRRLFDMLNRSVMVSAAPPGLSDLSLLAVTLREAGYPTRVNHQGNQISLKPNVELAIYRIIFDAVENVKQHNQVGTAIDIDFVWSAHGLQILVKDNGIEFANRATIQPEITGSEAHAEDLAALTQQVSGAGITGSRERAELFGGTVEAHQVPGVGFTVNALFPGVDQYRSESQR